MADWDQRFLKLAYHIASWSKNPGRKVGAVIAGPDNEIRSTGFNGIPRGSVRDDIEERYDSPSKELYFWAAHAERNAIYNAARVGIPLKDCRIYSTLFPCSDCTIAIIQSGICELVTHKPNLEDPQWGEGFKRGQIMLEEAGIRVKFLETEE